MDRRLFLKSLGIITGSIALAKNIVFSHELIEENEQIYLKCKINEKDVKIFNEYEHLICFYWKDKNMNEYSSPAIFINDINNKKEIEYEMNVFIDNLEKNFPYQLSL